MPNKASKAGHKPERSCVICRKKTRQAVLFRLTCLKGDWIIDLKHIIAGRGYYICNDNECLLKLDKWKMKRKRWISEKQKNKKC